MYCKHTYKLYETAYTRLTLAFVLMLRPFFPELVMSMDLLSFEHPRYFYFTIKPGKTMKKYLRKSASSDKKKIMRYLFEIYMFVFSYRCHTYREAFSLSLLVRTPSVLRHELTIRLYVA